jgi:hypothetical protein
MSTNGTLVPRPTLAFLPADGWISTGMSRTGPRTGGLAPRRLDADDDLAHAFLYVEHHETWQSQHLLRQPDTVAHRQGPPSLGGCNHRNDVEVPDLVGGWFSPPRERLTPHSSPKTPFGGGAHCGVRSGEPCGCREPRPPSSGDQPTVVDEATQAIGSS